jgi:2-polyprenyl-3-methyl-5-hydroxy-6-metoxy-1,4-benzoquinol methylase
MGARERMFVTSLEQVRLDHLRRYEWAARQLVRAQIIDAACGCGYGSWLLAKSGLSVFAVDASVEAIDFAEEHWREPNCSFNVMDLHQPALPFADVVVSFETIEHLKRPKIFLRAAAEAAPRLIASVPNETVFPHSRKKNPFHMRHYTKRQFEKRLRECGWRVTRWFGQADKHSDLVPDLEGRTLIADCERA